MRPRFQHSQTLHCISIDINTIVKLSSASVLNPLNPLLELAHESIEWVMDNSPSCPLTLGYTTPKPSFWPPKCRSVWHMPLATTRITSSSALISRRRTCSITHLPSDTGPCDTMARAGGVGDIVERMDYVEGEEASRKWKRWSYMELRTET